MNFERVTLQNCHQARGIVVVIDVLRAFTTAAYAFDRGVQEIILAGGVEEARGLKEIFPGAMLLGEVNGVKIPDFDLGNSPSALFELDLTGARLIQRTTAGTQGVVRAVNAERVYAAGLCNAGATACLLAALQPETVTFVVTGVLEGGWGDEDSACADWIEGLLANRANDPQLTAERVRGSRSGLHYDGTRADFPPADLDLALHIDCFSFAMEVIREEGLFKLRKQPVRL